MTRPLIAIPIPTAGDLEYNRRSWQDYATAVERSGGEPVAVPLGEGASATLRRMQECAGLVLPGSPADVEPGRYGQERQEASAPADPAREMVDQLLLEEAEQAGKPVLAICFGVQFLNILRGGTLLQDLTCVPVNHTAGRAVAVAHTVLVAPESLLGRMLASESANAPERNGFLRLPVNSSHHQAIGVPGDRLHIAARSVEDGVIEAVEQAGDRFVVGVQWHPERSFEDSAFSRALFGRLVAEAASWAKRSSSAA